MSVPIVAPAVRSDAWENRSRCRRIRANVASDATLSSSYLDAVEKRRAQMIAEALVPTPIEELGERILDHSPTWLGLTEESILTWSLGVGERRVLLLGASDKGQSSRVDRNSPKLVGGVIRGLGAAGAKLGVVQALFACSLVAERHGPGALDGVTLLVPSAGAFGSVSSRALIEAEARDHEAVLALNPSGPRGSLTIARSGSARYEVVITGQTQCADAGFELAAQIPRIAALSNSVIGTTVVATDGQFGAVGSKCSVSAILSIDVRARSVDELMRVDGAIRGLRSAVRGAALEIHGGLDRSPMDIGVSAELFMLAGRAARALGIPAPDGVALDDASEANIAAALGIPTLDGFGAARANDSPAELRVEAECVTGRTALLAEMIDTLVRCER